MHSLQVTEYFEANDCQNLAACGLGGSTCKA